MIQTQNKYRYELMSWVKENCLSLVGLLNICQRGKKSIYSNSSKANSDSRGEEVNEGNMMQKEENIPIYCLEEQCTSTFVLTAML